MSHQRLVKYLSQYVELDGDSGMDLHMWGGGGEREREVSMNQLTSGGTICTTIRGKGRIYYTGYTTGYTQRPVDSLSKIERDKNRRNQNKCL